MNTERNLSRAKLGAVLAGAVFLFALSGHAERFPPGSNLLDITSMGAIPDDATDDTAQIQAAVNEALIAGRMLYAPCGEYLVSDQILGKRTMPTGTAWTHSFMLHGEARDCVTFRVPPNTPAFATVVVNTPKAVFLSGSNFQGSPQPTGTGGYNEAFRNTFEHFTIRIGAGNPGANGIEYSCSNRGAIRDVKVIFEGVGEAGIRMQRPWPGPCLIADTEIDGGKYGVWDGQIQYEMVLQNVTVRNQTICGLQPSGDNFVVEGLQSFNTVPGVCVGSARAQVMIVDSVLSGGSATRGGIEVVAGAHATVRNVMSTGYGSTILHGTTQVAGPIGEWTSFPRHSLFDDPNTVASLNLSNDPPPAVFVSEDWDDWADVRSFGGSAIWDPNDPAEVLDDTEAFRDAMNAGKPIVYSPQGAVTGERANRYHFNATVTIPCTVERLIGMENVYEGLGTFDSGEAMFRSEGCSASDPPLVIEKLWGGGTLNGGPFLELLDDRRVYVRDLQFGGQNLGIRALTGTGKLWLSNVVMQRMEVANRDVRAVQYNPESFDPTPGILVKGGTFRVLGLKTEGMAEGGNPTLTCRDNAACEIVGGTPMPCVAFGVGTNGKPPLLFRVIDSDFSATYKNWCGAPTDNGTANVQIEETRGLETRQLLYTSLPADYAQGGSARFMPLYSSRGKRCKLDVPAALPATVKTASTTNAATVTIPAVAVPSSPASAPYALFLALSTERNPSANVLTAMWNGKAMTLARRTADPSNINAAELWYLLGADPGVTADLVVTLNVAANEARAAAFVVEGLEPQAPEAGISAGQATLPITTSLDTVSPGAFVLDVFAEAQGSIALTTTQAGQTLLADVHDGGASLGVSWRLTTSEGAYASGWQRGGGGTNRAAHVVLAFTACGKQAGEPPCAD